tara:strand:+ start:414 stop:1148 length:735 start_codon:yes stop_codon:yes gene_type:complete
MLGLGTGIIKGAGRASNLGIITDNLVLKHNYSRGQVRQVSTGAASFNIGDASGTDYIDVGTIAIGTNDLSLCCWCYVDAFTDNAPMFMNRGGGTNPGVEIRTAASGGNHFECILDIGASSQASNSSTDKVTNRWYHVCATFDRSGDQILYVDGVLEDSDGCAGDETDDLSHSTSAKIGKRSVEFRGYIANVGYWNRVLTQAEVRSIMWKDYSGLTSSEKTSMVSWWNLSTNANDSHGSNNGTLS